MWQEIDSCSRSATKGGWMVGHDPWKKLTSPRVEKIVSLESWLGGLKIGDPKLWSSPKKAGYAIVVKIIFVSTLGVQNGNWNFLKKDTIQRSIGVCNWETIGWFTWVQDLRTGGKNFIFTRFCTKYIQSKLFDISCLKLRVYWLIKK